MANNPLEHDAVIIGREGGIVVLTINNPPVNAASRAVRAGLMAGLRHAAEDSAVIGVVITGQGSAFMGGADIREFGQAPADPTMPAVIRQIEDMNIPVAAAINGAALGAGLELALGCDLRIAAGRAMLGLPEVKLGIIPGAGGTQRLPRLTGIATALRLITRGEMVAAGDAAAMSIVDAITETRPDTAAILALAARPGKRVLSKTDGPDESEEEIASAVAAAERSGRSTPYIKAAIESVLDSRRLPFDVALAKERETFQQLRSQPAAAALRYLFFAERKATAPIAASNGDVNRVAIVGMGLMGAGIAVAMLIGGLDVVVTDVSEEARKAGYGRIAGILEAQAKRGRLRDDAASLLSRLIVVSDLSLLAQADLVIEAVVEDMAVKTDLFRSLDGICGPGVILATNTSYLDIDVMTASLSHPERVAGLHFFNPAHVMKLVEIIRTARSDSAVISCLQRLTRRIGKTGVLARVGEGFIGNRMLFAYRQQCEYLLEEGASPFEVDRAMTEFGMAQGPFATSDMSGLEIAWRTRQRLAATRDPGERYVRVADRLCEMGRLGRKANAGWFDYPNPGGSGVESPAVLEIIAEESATKGIARQPLPRAVILRRALAALINEGCLIVEEALAERASDIDVVMTNGYGFPRDLGGPLYWAAQQPPSDIAAMFTEMSEASPTKKISSGWRGTLAELTK